MRSRLQKLLGGMGRGKGPTALSNERFENLRSVNIKFGQFLIDTNEQKLALFVCTHLEARSCAYGEWTGGYVPEKSQGSRNTDALSGSEECYNYSI
mmetsp:Transcript_9117/g.40046  ORF Transcript_9117/g.40046 Transcript_9117/m.40046 type:complete len:96 (+) Transcript_9117:769-1056(+)